MRFASETPLPPTPPKSSPAVPRDGCPVARPSPRSRDGVSCIMRARREMGRRLTVPSMRYVSGPSVGGPLRRSGHLPEQVHRRPSTFHHPRSYAPRSLTPFHEARFRVHPAEPVSTSPCTIFFSQSLTSTSASDFSKSCSRSPLSPARPPFRVPFPLGERDGAAVDSSLCSPR